MYGSDGPSDPDALMKKPRSRSGKFGLDRELRLEWTNGYFEVVRGLRKVPKAECTVDDVLDLISYAGFPLMGNATASGGNGTVLYLTLRPECAVTTSFEGHKYLDLEVLGGNNRYLIVDDDTAEIHFPHETPESDRAVLEGYRYCRRRAGTRRACAAGALLLKVALTGILCILCGDTIRPYLDPVVEWVRRICMSQEGRGQVSDTATAGADWFY